MEIKKSIHFTDSFRKYTLLVVFIASAIRLFIAGTIELGNDEVYYILYALFPGLSHFDHPPMVGFVIQLFSLNLTFDSEIFIRLGSVIFSAISTWTIFRIGEKIANSRVGFFSALLFTASIYCSVIAGTFILPDTPQMLFWLLALYYFLNAIPEQTDKKQAGRNIILAGIFTGLGMLSKYTSVYLWLGAGLYILLFNRKWLLKPSLYISALISVILFLPVIIWNIDNQFISFTFQGERALISTIHPEFLLTEILGEFIYNNPINFILIIITIIQIIKGQKFCKTESQRYLLLMSIPLIATFWFVALFRRTLPHWTGPAFFPLIILTACRFDNQQKTIKIPKAIKTSLALLIFILLLGWVQIKTGLIPLQKAGIPDPTLDLYGWDQRGEKFRSIREEAIATDLISEKAPIIDRRWFPAANYDYYLAKDAGISVLGLNSVGQIHKYAWTNNIRGGFYKGMDAWVLDSSREPQKPVNRYGKYFQNIYCYDTIMVTRSHRTVDTLYVYICTDLKTIPQLGQTIK